MDYGGHPVVASNATNDDAAAMAESRELNGYHLVPLDPKRNYRGTINYIRVDDHYEIWEMYFWLEANYKHAHWRPEDVTTARRLREITGGRQKHRFLTRILPYA